MKTFPMLALIAGVLAAGPAAGISWSDFDGLVGEWHGSGTEPGYTLDVTQTWEWVYDGKFLRLTSYVVARDDDGRREVRENVGYMSYDNDRNAFVFRQFFSAGYVATYDVLVEEGGKVIDFGERAAESGGGVRARMVITFAEDGSFKQEIDLAFSSQDFATRQSLTMRR
jgi:hypothetical protein